jgi:hypothetical protein
MRTPNPRKAIRAAAIASAVLALVTTATGTAIATSPTTVDQPIHRVILSPCPGFTIQATFDFVRRVTTFYDTDGTPIRQTIHADLAGSFTQNATTGYTLPIIGTRYIETDLLTGVVKSTGTNAHILAPGTGTIQLGAGQILTDDGEVLLAAGRLDPGGSPALCEALAAG